MKCYRAFLSLVLALVLAGDPVLATGIGAPLSPMATPTQLLFSTEAFSPVARWFESIILRSHTLFQITRWPRIEEWGTLTISMWPQLRPAGELGGGRRGNGSIRLFWPTRFSWPHSFMMADPQAGSGGKGGSKPSIGASSQALDHLEGQVRQLAAGPTIEGIQQLEIALKGVAKSAGFSGDVQRIQKARERKFAQAGGFTKGRLQMTGFRLGEGYRQFPSPKLVRDLVPLNEEAALSDFRQGGGHVDGEVVYRETSLQEKSHWLRVKGQEELAEVRAAIGSEEALYGEMGDLLDVAAALVKNHTVELLRTGGWVEVGLHTTTGGKGHQTLSFDELVAMGQTLLDHRMMVAVDRLDVLRALRANAKNDDKLICFLLDGQPELAEEAAAAGANVLNGQGFTKERIDSLHAQYPHVVFIEDLSREEGEARMIAHLAQAREVGVDGILLKPFFKKDSSWFDQFPEGPLSLAGLRAAYPDWILMPAGGVFQSRAGAVLARLENLTPAVGFNPAGDFQEQVAEYDFARADGLTRASGKIEPITLESWAALSLESQEKVLKQALAAMHQSDPSRTLALTAPLEAGQPLRAALIPRAFLVNEADPFATLREVLSWQLKTVGLSGVPFYKIFNDPSTIHSVKTPIPGQEGQWVDHMVNLGLAAKPGGGKPAIDCGLCPDVIRLQPKFADELWMTWGPFNYYFNPFPVWPPEMGRAVDDQPFHVVVAWNQGHRSQKDLYAIDVLSAMREQWMRMNASPSLGHGPLFRLFMNGWSYGDPEIHGGASQDHIHGQFVRLPFDSEKAPIEWTGERSTLGVRVGKVQLLLSPHPSTEEDLYANVFESPKTPEALRQLDQRVSETLHAIADKGHSFNIFFYETDGMIRVYVGGRPLGRPEGAANSRGGPEVLARQNIFVTQFERLFEYTAEQRAAIQSLTFEDFKAWLKNEMASGLLAHKDLTALYQTYFAEMRQVMYPLAWVEELLFRLGETIPGTPAWPAGITWQPLPMGENFGEKWTLDLSQVDGRVTWAENYRRRDLAKEFHTPKDPNVGRTVEEFAHAAPSPEEILLAVNNTQEHFVMNNTLLVHDGHLVRTELGRFDLLQAFHRWFYSPPTGTYHLLSLDPGHPAIVDVELDSSGQLVGPVPIQEGFAGPLIMRNGQPTIDGVSGIRFQRQPSLAGDDVGYAADKRQAHSAMGYTADHHFVIIQVREDQTLAEFVKILQSQGVHDAILTGTSADVQRYSPLLPTLFVWAKAQANSILELALGTPRGRRVGTALLFRRRFQGAV